MNKILLKITLIFAAILLGVGCPLERMDFSGSGGGGGGLSIAYFLSSNDEIFGLQNARLTWHVYNSTSVEIDNGIGAVSASGSMVVTPTQTTIYTLTARNSTSVVSASLKISVRVVLVSWWKGITAENCPKVNGTIRNTSDKGIYDVEISFFAYDASEVLIDAAKGFAADRQTIAPEATAAFEGIFSKLNSWSQIDHLRFQITWKNSNGIQESYTERINIR